jgi:hypothetical protein
MRSSFYRIRAIGGKGILSRPFRIAASHLIFVITLLLLLSCAGRVPPFPDLSSYVDVQRLDCREVSANKGAVRGGYTVYVSEEAAKAWVRPTGLRGGRLDIMSSELKNGTVTWTWYSGQKTYNCSGTLCWIEFTVKGSLNLSNLTYSETDITARATGPTLRELYYYPPRNAEGVCTRAKGGPEERP